MGSDVVHGPHGRRTEKRRPRHQESEQCPLDAGLDPIPVAHQVLRPVDVQHVIVRQERANPGECSNLDVIGQRLDEHRGRLIGRAIPRARSREDTDVLARECRRRARYENHPLIPSGDGDDPARREAFRPGPRPGRPMKVGIPAGWPRTDLSRWRRLRSGAW